MKTRTMTNLGIRGTAPSQAIRAQIFTENGAQQILMALLVAAIVMLPHRTWAAVPAVDNANGASNVLSVSATLCQLT